MRIPVIDGPVPDDIKVQNYWAHLAMHYLMDDNVQMASHLIEAAIGQFGPDWPLWAVVHTTDVLIAKTHAVGLRFGNPDGTGGAAFVKSPNGPLTLQAARPDELASPDEVPPIAHQVLAWFIAREADDPDLVRNALQMPLRDLEQWNLFVNNALSICADNLARLGGCPA